MKLKIVPLREFRKLPSKSASVEVDNRKAYERREIADTKITDTAHVPQGAFKDPYLFDILGLKDEFQEAYFESAILRKLQSLILEFGKGFVFAERQKQIIIDGQDFKLDLLFYSRNLKCLVAVDLKQT